MKALVVAPGYPYPINGGNRVSLHGYHVALRNAGCDEVHFLGFDMGGQSGEEFEMTRLVPKPPRITSIGLVKHLMGGSILLGRYHSKLFARELKQVAEDGNYDVVLFQHAYMAQFLPYARETLRRAFKVASAEVLESRAYREKARLSESRVMRALFSREAQILDKAETRTFSGFDRVAFYSPEDFEHYRACGGTTEGHVVNLGLDLSRYEPLTSMPQGPFTVTFFGAFSWFANTDALVYLLREIWPEVKRNIPEAVLKIAGRDMPEWVEGEQRNGIQVLGCVPSIRELLASVHVVLSPIRIAGGVRLKMLESLAWGRPVVSTSAGVEGLEADLAAHVIVANTPKEFADRLLLLKNEVSSTDRAWKGCDVVRRQYDARGLKWLFCQ